MCDLEVDLAACTRAFGETAGYFTPEREALAALEAEGLIEIEGDRIRLTSEGRPLMRLVAAVFDRYLAASAGRHTAAV